MYKRKDSIPEQLMRDLPCSFILGIKDAMIAGSRRAWEDEVNARVDVGHQASFLGQHRHYRIKEAFHRTLEQAGASPSPIKNNRIVTGCIGRFTVANYNTRERTGASGRRSASRKELAQMNEALESLLLPDLFSGVSEPMQGVVFFVACFAADLKISPDAPVSIFVAVPDKELKGFLFKENLGMFVQRYGLHQADARQADEAKPKLKKNIKRRSNEGG